MLQKIAEADERPQLFCNTVPSKRFCEWRGQKCFGSLGELHKSEFPRQHPWLNTISEKVLGGEGMSPVPSLFHRRACNIIK